MSKHISISQQNQTLENDIKNLQSNFTQIITSGCHYYTQELLNHIKHINNALDNIKLDQEFQRGSKNWSKQFDSNDRNSNETSVKQLIEKGYNLTRELNTCLHTSTIQNKEENQMRELHSWACDSLLDYLQTLQPFASGSYARLDNIAHHLGVTDRYIGYRHNLTRSGNQPLNVHTVWADRKLPRVSPDRQQQSTPDWKNSVHAFRHYGPSASTMNRQTSNIQSMNNNNNPNLLGYLRPTQSTVTKRPGTTPNFVSRSLVYDNDHNAEVRKAGINLIFPGKTEFMDRYKKPEDLPNAPFTINPQPDYTLPGRPLSHLVPDSFSSEYTRSYVFPDSAKIENILGFVRGKSNNCLLYSILNT